MPLSKITTTNPEPQVLSQISNKPKAPLPMTKDDYWQRREARDLAQQIRIRRSGAWQAAIQSTGLLQYNLSGTLEDYLKVVEQAAERGIVFVNRD